MAKAAYAAAQKQRIQLDRIFKKDSNEDMENENYLISGTISVKSALENDRRPCHALYVDRNKRTREFSYIIAQAKKRHVPVFYMTKDEIRSKFDAYLQGIVLEAGSRQIPALSQKIHAKGLVCYVDGVEDPYNIGSICRTLYAAGCTLLVLPRRNWDYSEPTILKASAGSWDKMEIVMIEEDAYLVKWAYDNRLSIVCADRKEAMPLFDWTFAEDTLMVIGGSKRGISASFMESEHQSVYIPYGRDFKNALDAPSAAAIMAFSYTRQFFDAD